MPHDLLPRHRAVRVAHQIVQQLELAQRQVDDPAVDPDLIGVDVELHPADHECPAGPGLTGERGVDQGQQLGHPVGPGHARGGSGRQRLDGLLGVTLAHAEQDGDHPRQPYRADELHRPYDRQRGADENDVGSERPGLQQGLGAVGDAHDLHSLAFQGRGQVMDHGHLRIGHQQHGRRPCVPVHLWCRLRLDHPHPPIWVSRSGR